MSRRFQHWWTAATVALIVSWVAAPAWAAETIVVDLPAQPLGDALVAIANQTDTNIFVDKKLVAGLQTAAIKGELKLDEIIDRLLKGTGLTHRFVNEHTVVVAAAATSDSTDRLQSLPQPGEELRLASAEATRSEQAAHTDGLEEVTVTGTIDFTENDAFGATKMGMPVVETPFSMLIVTNDLMKMASVNKVSDLYKLDPSGGTNQRQGGYGLAFARGYEVPVYIDGFRQSVEVDLDFAAFDRMELIKGGTSTLYGQNEPGGVLNFVSKLPQSEFAVQLKGEGGSNNFYRGELDATGPMFSSERWAWRTILVHQNDDTFQDFGQNDRFAVIPSLMYRGERGNFLFRLHYENQDLKYSNGLAVQLDGPIPTGLTWDAAVRQGLLGLKFVDGIPRSRAFGPQVQNKRVVLAQAQYDYRFDSGWKLRANVQRNRGDDLVDLTLLFGPLDAQGHNRLQYQSPARLIDENYSAELNLFGDFTLMGRKHTLFFGADYADLRSLGWTGGGNFLFGYENTNFNVYNPDYSAFVISNADDLLPYPYNRDFVYSGLTVQAVFNPIDRLKILLGGRFSADHSGRNFFGFQGMASTAEALAVAKAGDNTYPHEATDHFAKQFGLTYKLTGSVNAYASYAESFVPTSDVRFTDALAQGERIAPPQGTTAEVGLKGDFAGDWSFSAALFQIEHDIIVGDPVHPGFSVPVGGRRNRGVELSLQGSLFTGFNVYGAAAFQDPKYLEGPYKGLRSAAAARIGLSLFGTYELLHGPLKGLGFGAGVVHKGDRKGGDVQNNLMLDATGEPYIFDWGNYTEVDARVFYSRNSWQAYGSVTNLLDEKYYSPAFDWLALVQNVNPGRVLRVGFNLKL